MVCMFGVDFDVWPELLGNSPAHLHADMLSVGIDFEPPLPCLYAENTGIGRVWSKHGVTHM